MKDFVYSVNDIFSKDALLKELNAGEYLVASYQRGYKWKSFGKNDPVPLFLTDTYDAFLNNSPEYYLQYITVKKNTEDPSRLEVIDGQQRLTTISLFFYVASEILKDYGNITEGKVKYERHLENDIFKNVLNLGKVYDEVALKEKLRKEQDTYYLYHACGCIRTFFNLFGGNSSEIKAYVNYFKEKVKIIINLEESITSPEEVFSNLNDNKVELTDEFLIKGLLFTKSVRDEHMSRSFNEIQDLRARIAYKWDEIDNWFSQPAHIGYFTNKKGPSDRSEGGIGFLLDLLRPDPKVGGKGSLIAKFQEQFKVESEVEESATDTTHALFNAYNDALDTSAKVDEKLREIMNLSKRLKNWYYENEIHALLGFYILNDGKLRLVMNLSSTRLKEVLYEHLYNSCQLEELSVADLNYQDHKESLNKIFSALNIFRIVKKDDIRIDWERRFDFDSFKKNWSLEHIYPQTPVIKDARDLIDFKPWFEKHLTKLEDNSTTEIGHVNLLTLLNRGIEDELKNALSRFNKRIVESIKVDVHSIGNLALLERGDNSSFSNHIFPHKRRKMLDRINSGSFVPQHTIAAFTKSLHPIENGENNRVSFAEETWDWTEKDCQANEKWISTTYSQLMKVVEQNIKK